MPVLPVIIHVSWVDRMPAFVVKYASYQYVLLCVTVYDMYMERKVKFPKKTKKTIVV